MNHYRSSSSGILKKGFCGAAALTIFFAICYVWLKGEKTNVYRNKIIHSLQSKLIAIDQMPKNLPVDMIYVLGGGQRSLTERFRKVVDVYKNNRAKKILILSRPGITEFNHKLKRNLTNDEWAILELHKLGIPEEIIEPIETKSNFFGTFSEAQSVSKIIENRKYKHSVLITSPSHTQRVKISFIKFLRDSDWTFYVQCPEGKSNLFALIVEFVKLKIYKHFLL